LHFKLSPDKYIHSSQELEAFERVEFLRLKRTEELRRVGELEKNLRDDF
jgi:hypothetical protein